MSGDQITADLLLQAYASGLFPMAETADDPELFWINPEKRGIIPLDNFYIPSRLARTISQDKFDIRIDTDFESVINGCASPSIGREETWINKRIRTLYSELFDHGVVHTVEAWRNGRLVGGLYGLELGGVFFGESMFQRERDASKVALVYLAARLRLGGFSLLDTQFVTPHLARFGAVEVKRDFYMQLLKSALSLKANWWIWPQDTSIRGSEVLRILR